MTGRTLWARRIPMRDGVELVGDVVLPAGEGPFPVVLQRTPYSRTRLLSPISWVRLVQRGYAFVAVDVRGRGDAGGEFRPFRADGYDGYDTVEWIAEQPWSNGRVGMVGVSYDALTQWWTARHKPPHLSCVVPLACGAVDLGPIPFSGTGIPLQYWFWWMHYVTGHTAQHTGSVSWSAGWTHRPLRTLDEAFGTGHPWWQQYVAGEWDFGDAGMALSDAEWAQFDTPVLIGLGWWDEQTAIDTWAKLSLGRGASNAYLLIGGWDHAGNHGPRPVLGGLDVSASVIDVFGEVERFLALHLKEEGAAPARCRVFHTGAMRWESFEDWPPPSRPAELYLGAERTLIDTPPALGADTFVYDPAVPPRSMINLDMFAWSDPPLDRRYAQRGTDVLVYTSAPLARGLTVAGKPHADLYVSSDRPDTDIFVELLDLHPDGRAITFATGPGYSARRLRYLDDGRERLLEPREIRRVRIPLPWIHHTFQRGHAVQIAIRSTSWPFRALNFNGGDHWADETEPLAARNTIHRDQTHASKVVLPVLGDGR